MAPKKPITVLTLPGTSDIPLPPPETSWPMHPVVKAYFLENVRQVPVEAEVPYENRSSYGGFIKSKRYFEIITRAIASPSLQGLS